MLAPALALTLALATSQQCPIPHQAMVVMETDVRDANRSVLATFDLADASETCAIDLPGGPSPSIDVASNGMIYLAIQPHNMTRYTTDAGHLAIFTPDGRLLHRVYNGMEGIQSIALDERGRLFVEAGDGMFVNGATVMGRTTLTMYDAASLKARRAFSLDEHFMDYGLSRDGRYLALCYEFGRDVGHVDLIDPSTGALVRRIDVPAERAMFEGNTLWIWSQKGISSIDLPGGTVRSSSRTELWNDSRVVDGVEYKLVHGPVTFTGQQFTMTQTFTRRRLSDGTMLTPIIARGIAGPYFIVKPDPALAAATPGPELAAATFPSPAKLATTLGNHTAGIEFDDTISHRHYSYLGDLARIDAPNDQQMTLVDCKDGVEVVADTLLKTYRVIPMDPLPLATPVPPKVDLQRIAQRYPLPTAKATTIDSAHRHSSLATTAYSIDLSMRFPGVPTAMEMVSEREYAQLGATYPSCATRAFGGEPASVQPGRLFELADPVASLLAHFPQLGIGADLPTPPLGSILVYAESTQPNQPRTAAVNITNVQTIGPDALSRFALPSGYTQEPGSNY